MTTIDEAQEDWQDYIFLQEPEVWYWWNITRRGELKNGKS